MRGLVVVLPAYREEANLETTVTDFLRVLDEVGEPHRIVVVDDGSEDGTGAVAAELAARHPGRVEVVRHDTNQGYGAAVRSGIAAALEHTDCEAVFLTDADGQFRARQLPEFLEEARRERADVVVGYRAGRADPLVRRVNGYLWNRICRLLLGVAVRDVDCAYKLIDRRLLERVRLRGDAAAISPELLARLRDLDARIVQRPVEHFPRRYGQQTGGWPSVIARSLVALLGIWLELLGRRPAGRAALRLARPRDPLLAGFTAAAIAVSIVACLYFSPHALAYLDAEAHMLIARRVISASTPGVAQLGAVWLPLPHLLTLPTIWMDAWYHSGLAGTVISMAGFVIAARCLYRIAHVLTGHRLAGLVAGLMFVSCPNVLYLQSTPMTELPLIACVAMGALQLLLWTRTGDQRRLALTAGAVLLGTLTRYEAWVFGMAVALVVAGVAWRRSPRGERLRRTVAEVVFFTVLAWAGIAGWVAWNAVIFGDPLYFLRGEFAEPSLWVSGDEATRGDWATSAAAYFYAMRGDIGTAGLVLAALGLVCLLARHRLRADALVPLTLLVFVPFFVYALYTGERPLQVPEISGRLYNVRFALIMILPVAVLSAYLVAEVRRSLRAPVRFTGYAAVGGALAATGLSATLSGVDTLEEAQGFRARAENQAQSRAASWLRANYDGGTVLMQSFGNEIMMFESRIPLRRVVYEGSFRQWRPALADPGPRGIRWIHIGLAPTTDDDVWESLRGDPDLDGYTLVYRASDRLVYRRKDS
ncbi:glycosyltransferase [Bailinhaonella thermotolerans]|uniref:Glycosyltransferase n=1 Tax=Bailinhaonella thermotolerans TaxID=1070861 RepID=A0A3A4A6N1_9ACTN|nr:glycosyltransferase [Bailinhaonella thermotolerans]RJL24225.1 glycosyltransferase [Bailinhaonella thermotolerans]